VASFAAAPVDPSLCKSGDHTMSKFKFAVRAAALAACTLATAVATQAATVNLKIVGFNDYHGTLETPGNFSQNLATGSVAKPVGGAEYMAAYISRMKQANPNTIVVGAGDFIGATPLISALFFDEPAVETLNAMGVDFIAVGNHEFDKGKDELRRLQNGGCRVPADPNSCRGFGSGSGFVPAPGTFSGARFKWLSANVTDTSTGRTLLPAFGVKTVGRVRVAFIGMTLKGTPLVVTPTGVAGLTFNDEAATVNALVPKLRAQGIEAIVVLVHQGGFQNRVTGDATTTGFITNDINGCNGNLRNANGNDSDLRAIVKQLDNAVDLVISGHTHAAYNCSANTIDVTQANVATPRSTGIPNKVGRLVPVTSSSAFGRVLTEVDLQLDTVTRDVVPGSVSPTNRLVDRTDAAINAAITADPTVKNIVSAYSIAVSPLANQVIATITAPISNTANTAGEMPAGDLIADAQLLATQPAGVGGAQFAFMNAGGVRNPGFTQGAAYPYALTYGNAFQVQPFGNSLVTMTLTAQQIKNVLEQQFANCLGQGGANRIMQISNGLAYTWDNSGNCGMRIRSVTFTPTNLLVDPAIPNITGPVINIVTNGVVQAVGPFRVTVNNFMATGGDGFSTFVGGLNPLGGAQDIDALIAYLASFKAPAAPYDPTNAALSKPRITRLN